MKTNPSVQRLLSKNALPIIVLSFVMAFLIGCKKNVEPNPNNIDDNEIVNPAYVPIDWNHATLLSANDSTGDYQIQFSEEMPELQPGSVIAIDQDTAVQYIFIKTVNKNGNTVNVTTTEAYLTDIFADTDFTLSTVEGNRSSSKGKVFYPVAAYMSSENGTQEVLDLKKFRDGGFGFTHDLWHYGENFDGEVLSSGNNYTLYMEKLSYNFDVDLEMYLNFSGRTVHEIVGNVINRYRSKALGINASLLGTFDTEQKIRCDVRGSGTWSPDYDIWKHNLFRPLRVRFIVYGVPVVIKINSDLYRQVQVTTSGEISAYTGFKDNALGRLGFKWQQSNGMNPIASFSNTFEFMPPTIEGKGSIEAKAWAFPRIRLLLYGLLGPSFDIKPYLSTKIAGGFKEELLETANDFCAWSLDCNAGLDAACGLSMQFMGYEVENFSTPNWNVFEKPLYHSPEKVLHNSKSDGQKRTVSFSVYDHNYIYGTDMLTPLPQFVKFEANGQLSSQYGIAHNGQVNVNWTPQNNDILYAKLYDLNGNVISWDTVKAVQQESVWVDLGLPSGTLWATRNVGANSPEQRGYYFAWGETQEKSYYDWDTYRYYNTSTNSVTKYNTNDGLTTLQQNDDAATYILGNGQRMPTYDDWNELMTHCTQTYTTLNGVKGVRFTASNGNSIFLPAVGFRHEGGIFDGEHYPQHYDGCGLYWTSSRSEDNPNNAWYVLFKYNTETLVLNEYLRLFGLPVRPVRSPN